MLLTMPRRPASTGALPRTPLKPSRVPQLEEITKHYSAPTHISISSALLLKRKKSNLDPLLGMEVKELSTYVSVDTWMSAVSRFLQATLAKWTAVIRDSNLFESRAIKSALTRFYESGELGRYIPLSSLLNCLVVWANDNRVQLVDLSKAKDIEDLVYFRHDPLYMLGPKDEDVTAAQRKLDVVAVRDAQEKRRTEYQSRVPWNQAILLFELKHDSNGRLLGKLMRRSKAGVAAKGTVKKSTKVRNYFKLCYCQHFSLATTTGCGPCSGQLQYEQARIREQEAINQHPGRGRGETQEKVEVPAERDRTTAFRREGHRDQEV